MKHVLTLALAIAISPNLPAQATPTSKSKSIPDAKVAPKSTSLNADKEPAVRVEPAAIALLDKAIATYKAGTGLSMKIGYAQSTADKYDTILWKAPHFLRINFKSGVGKSNTILFDGKALYLPTTPTTFRRIPQDDATPDQIAESVGTWIGLENFLPSLLSGKNFLSQAIDKAPNHPGYRYYVRTLPLTIVDGQQCNGLRETVKITIDGETIERETTAWFDAASSTLRRLQTVTIDKNYRNVITYRVTETNLNPEFAPDTFVWSPPPGVTEETAEDSETYWDPKLVVGTAPFALSGKDMKGKAVSLANYKGKVVLLDFWATWCGPCVSEMPSVLSNYKKYHGKGFEIIGISLDQDKAALTSFVKKHQMAWPQLFDGKAWQTPNAVRYGVKAIPFTLLIGKDGKIAAVNPRGEKLDPAIKSALAQ
jgi:thiol-disulfide isomerase/thioredoxin